HDRRGGTARRPTPPTPRRRSSPSRRRRRPRRVNSTASPIPDSRRAHHRTIAGPGRRPRHARGSGRPSTAVRRPATTTPSARRLRIGHVALRAGLRLTLTLRRALAVALRLALTLTLALRWPLNLTLTLALRLAVPAEQRLERLRGGEAGGEVVVEVDDPGVLAAATLGGVDDERALLQRHPGESAGGDVAVLAREDERPQVEMPRGDAVGEECGGRRQIEDRLRHPVARVAADRRRRRFEHVRRGSITDDDAVPAALVRRLEHQLVEIVEHVRPLVVVHAPEGRHVGDQRLLAEVV